MSKNLSPNQIATTLCARTRGVLRRLVSEKGSALKPSSSKLASSLNAWRKLRRWRSLSRGSSTNGGFRRLSRRSGIYAANVCPTRRIMGNPVSPKVQQQRIAKAQSVRGYKRRARSTFCGTRFEFSDYARCTRLSIQALARHENIGRALGERHRSGPDRTRARATRMWALPGNPQEANERNRSEANYDNRTATQIVVDQSAVNLVRNRAGELNSAPPSLTPPDSSSSSPPPSAPSSSAA